MHLVLWKLIHRFLAHPNALEVTLAIKSDEFREYEDGEITIIVESEDVKNMTIAQIESLAVARAITILGERTPLT